MRDNLSFLKHDLPCQTIFISHPTVVLAPVVFPEFHESVTSLDEFVIVRIYFFTSLTFDEEGNRRIEFEKRSSIHCLHLKTIQVERNYLDCLIFIWPRVFKLFLTVNLGIWENRSVKLRSVEGLGIEPEKGGDFGHKKLFSFEIFLEVLHIFLHISTDEHVHKLAHDVEWIRITSIKSICHLRLIFSD